MPDRSVRARIESAFVGWGRFVVRHRLAAVVACLIATAALGSQLGNLRVDNADEAFLRADDAERVRYDAFCRQFDAEGRAIALIAPPAIFDIAFLERLRAFHRAVEERVPYVEEVTSLINARNTRGDGDRLIVEDLLENWPDGPEDLAALRERVLGNPLYRNILISENGRFTTVTVKPLTWSPHADAADVLEGFDEAGDPGEADGPEPVYLTSDETYELAAALLAVAAEFDAPDFQVYLVGGPLFEYMLLGTMQRDASASIALSLGVISFLLLLLFRSPMGVLMPLAVITTSLVSSMGVMVILDIPFSVTLNMIPVFLLVVGVCDSVHILVIVYQKLGEGVPRDEAIAAALGHSGLAVVMTSVTTACGVLSFALADLEPIAQLGIVAPIGVMLAMAYTLLLLPALVSLSPAWLVVPRGGRIERSSIDRLLTLAADASTRHPLAVLSATAAVLLVAFVGFQRVGFSHHGMRWFPEEDPLRVASELFDREFKGASTLEVLVDTGTENGLHAPDVLRRIESSMRRSESLDVPGVPVNKAVSIVDIVKETNQALNENRADHYRLPDDRRLVAQELLLFENSGTDDLEDVTDTRFSLARVTIRTPWVDAMLYLPFLSQLRSELSDVLGDAATFEFTGSTVIFTEIFEGVITSLARSYVFAFAVIAPILILLIGDLRRGMLAVIPNLIPVYLVLSLMGWLDIPIDVSTLLIGGVVLGLAVDDTIHFMHKFDRYYAESGDAEYAVRQTLATTGSALLFTTLVLALGFSVYISSYLENSSWFGILTSFATVVAFLADVLLGPALMVLATRGRRGERV